MKTNEILDIKIKFNPFALFVFDNGQAENLNMNTTESAGISPLMRRYYDTRIIKQAGPNLVYHQFALKRSIPANNGKSIVFHGYEDLDTSVAARELTEGQTPDGQTLSAYDIVAMVKQYGGYVVLTDVVQTTAIDDTVSEAVDKLSAQAAVVLDKLIRNALITDDEVDFSFPEGAESADGLTPTTHKMSVAFIRRAVNQLKRVNAPKIDGFYPLVLHPDCVLDLQTTEEYKDLVKYADPKRFVNGYVGDLLGARIYESTNVKISKNAGGKPVYWNHMFGKDSYATVDLSGGGLKTIIKPLGSSGVADALDQRGSAGWKASTVTKVLVPYYIMTLVCSSSTVPNESEYED